MYSIVYNYDLTVCVYGIEVYDEYNQIPFIKNWTGYNHNSLLVTTLVCRYKFMHTAKLLI